MAAGFTYTRDRGGPRRAGTRNLGQIPI